MANRSISAVLGCTQSTVELHVTALFEKTGTTMAGSSRAELRPTICICSGRPSTIVEHLGDAFWPWFARPARKLRR